MLDKLTSQEWPLPTGVGGQPSTIQGLEFVPSNINIIEKQDSQARLLINTNDIPKGNIVKIVSDNPRISIQPNEVEVVPDAKASICRQYITPKLPGTFTCAN